MSNEMTNPFADPSTPEPSDADIEAHITGMDIVSDVPGPFTGRNPRETFNWSSAGAPEVTIEAFAPEMQQEMRAKLAGLLKECASRLSGNWSQPRRAALREQPA
jgi:hypothetical protein